MAPWSRRQKYLCCVNIFLFIAGVVLVTLGLVIELAVVPAMVKSQAKKDVILKKDSSGTNGLNEFTNDWLHQNYTAYMNYYLYNYSNWMSILDGSGLPVMTEKGPYAYREHIKYNYNLSDSFNADGTEFTYTKTTLYVFDPDASCSDCYENDTFIMPDILFNVVGGIALEPGTLCMTVADIIIPIVNSSVIGHLFGPLQDPTSPEQCLGVLDAILNIIEITLMNKFNISKPITFENVVDVLSMSMRLSGVGPFIPIKVKDILWDGYQHSEPIFTVFPEVIEDFLDFVIKSIDKNATDLPPISIPWGLIPNVSINDANPKTTKSFTMLTGVNGYLQTGTVVKYWGQDTLPTGQAVLNGTYWWGGWDCWYNETDEIDHCDIDNQNLFVLDTTDATTKASANTPKYTPDCHCDACTNETAFLASKVKGTTADFFHALVQKDDVLSALVDDICRTMDFIYEKEVKVQDLDAYRFIVDPKMFSSSDPNNCGYCRQLPRDMYGKKEGSYCLPDGLLDISGCQPMNVEVIISNPHFYGVAPEVQKMFPYLHADPELHQTTLDIEPTTGTVLSANKRIQINYLVKNFPNTAFSSYPSGVYPMLWLNESYMMDKHTHDEIKSEVYTPQHVAKLLCYIVGVGLGSLLIVLALLSTLLNVFYCRRKEELVSYSLGKDGYSTDPYEVNN